MLATVSPQVYHVSYLFRQNVSFWRLLWPQNPSCWHLFHLTCMIWATFPHKRHRFGALFANKSIILPTFSSTMHHLASVLPRFHYFSTKISPSTCELKSKLENGISDENLKSTKSKSPTYYYHSFILFYFSFCLEPGPAECAERLNSMLFCLKSR
jgi:hypothetical protein